MASLYIRSLAFECCNIALVSMRIIIYVAVRQPLRACPDIIARKRP